MQQALYEFKYQNLLYSAQQMFCDEHYVVRY